MNICIIPARGGSKRIPHKNIKQFCGKPMIAWSIEAALQSKCFDRVIVSTDDSDIAVVAQAAGAEVPFIRPAELSDDYAGTIPVIRHATEWCIAQNIKVANVCCLYATAPFVQSEDLAKGLKKLKQEHADYAFSVTSYAFPVQRALKLTSRGRVEMLQPKHFATRSQDLEEVFHDAGQFYWGVASSWLEELIFFAEGSVPVFIPRHRVQDIDTPEDWVRAEWLFKAMKSKPE